MPQDVNITIRDGGLGILPPTGDDVHAVIGCSSTGPTATVFKTSSISALIAQYGYGPMVEAAAIAIALTGNPVICMRTPNTNAATSSSVTQAGGGTSVVTLTGTALDTYDAIVTVVTGGTIGVAGCVIKYSLDGGQTSSPNIALGTANTYAIPNTGITLNFGAGTLVAAATYKFTTTEALWGVSDVQACFTALKNSTQEFRFIHLVGKTTAANATTFDTEMASMATVFRWAGLLCHARDNNGGENEATWLASLQTDYLSYSSLRVSVTAGHYMITSPISGRLYRRPLSFAVAARLIGGAISTDAGRVRDGSLRGVASSDSDGKIYHDERTVQGLDSAKFLTVRTIIGRPGFFVMNPNMFAPNGSDFIWWQYRSVIDKTCKITREVLLNYLNDSVRLNPTTGFILEKDALDLESRLRSAYRDSLVAPGDVTAVSATVSRVDNIISTKTINVTVRVTPLGYLKAIEVDLGFTNPALLAAA